MSLGFTDLFILAVEDIQKVPWNSESAAFFLHLLIILLVNYIMVRNRAEFLGNSSDIILLLE